MARVAFTVLLLIYSTLLYTPASATQQSKHSDRILSKQWSKLWQQEIWKSPALNYPYQSCFKRAAAAQRLPLTLLVAVARGESDFNPAAKSSKNAHGIMQIQWPQTAHELGIYHRQDLIDKPCLNITAGARYLRSMMDRYNQDTHRALAAYNYGPGRIPKGWPYQTLPQGAKWYSSYILQHVNAVLNDGYGIGTRYNASKVSKFSTPYQHEIIRFRQNSKAQNFLRYIRGQAPDLKLVSVAVSEVEFAVISRYKNLKEKDLGASRLFELGFSQGLK